MQFVYILSSRPRGAIYIGLARDLRARVEQHRIGAVPGHTRRYGIKTLVYFEAHATLEVALLREKQLKRWRRAWKNELIEKRNPEWQDLSNEIPL